MCVRLKEDVKTEVEAAAQTQREIHAQKQQAEKLAAQALKTTNARCETLATDSSGLKGGEELIFASLCLSLSCRAIRIRAAAVNVIRALTSV